MKLDLNKIEFDQSDINTIHDVVFNALGKQDLTNEQIIEYWDKLPKEIKLEALKWGVGDTPTRGNMYVWFKANCA
tara:strand:+ start:48 stop:272 length:225 start_codon:yes stop_codon:yes gene_type:complete